MLAVSLVFGAVLFELVTVYAVGKFCFLWWDGTLPRKILLTACAVVFLAALNAFIDAHPIDF